MTDHKDIRPFIVMIFMPGLWFCLLLAAVMAVVIAGLIDMVCLWITNSPKTDKLSILIMLSGVYCAVLILWQGRRFFKSPRTKCHAVRIEPEGAPELFKSIKEVCDKLSTPMPDNVLVAFSADFLVTEAKVTAFDGNYEGRTLCLSTPLMCFLGIEELQAIIAHELAHFTGEDTVYSREFYPIYEVTINALHKMDEEEGILIEFLLYLPRIIIAEYLCIFSGIERRISRKREFRADTIAADIISPEQMSSALVIAEVYGRLWPHAFEQIFVSLLQEGKRPANYLRAFANNFSTDPCLEKFAQEALTQGTGAFDSHPTLKERLGKLGQEYSPIRNDELKKTAIDMLVDRQGIEESLTAFEILLFKFSKGEGYVT